MQSMLSLTSTIATIETPCRNTDSRTQTLSDKVALKAVLLGLAQLAIPFSTMACVLHDCTDSTDLDQQWSNRNMRSQWKLLSEGVLTTISQQHSYVTATMNAAMRHTMLGRASLNHIIWADDSDFEDDM